LLTINLPGDGVLESVGKPLPGLELRIAEATLGEDAQDEARGGEVQVRGPGVFHGYWQRPDLDADIFTADRWFRTGDLGRQDDDGFLHLQGRASTVIVTESGKNIQPDEVEDHYCAHPWIAEAGLLGVDGRLVAVIIPDG